MSRPSSRAKLKPTTRDICGSVKGWNAHVGAGEDQCMPCKIAHADYQRDWRHRTGRSQGKLYTADDIAAIKTQARAGLVEPLLALAEKWRYKGEFGWGAWQEGEGPDQEGLALDNAAAELRAAVDAALKGG